MSAYVYVDPPEPAVGIWFCPQCLVLREFDTDAASHPIGGRPSADCPLYCTTCQTRIDEHHTVLERYPQPPVISETRKMSPADRAAGIERLRLARLSAIPLDDPEAAPPATSDDDFQAQLRQLTTSRHGPLG